MGNVIQNTFGDYKCCGSTESNEFQSEMNLESKQQVSPRSSVSSARKVENVQKLHNDQDGDEKVQCTMYIGYTLRFHSIYKQTQCEPDNSLNEETKWIEQMVQMGFHPDATERVLRECNGDHEEAQCKILAIFNDSNIGTARHCKERILLVLFVYSKWIESNVEQKENIMDIYNLINGGISANYTMRDLFHDYQRVIQNEGTLGYHNDAQQVDDFTGSDFFGFDPENICDFSTCYILKRHRAQHQSGEASESSNMWFVGDGVSESDQSTIRSVAIQQCLDTIHCFVHHEIRINLENVTEKFARQKSLNSVHGDDGDEKDEDNLHQLSKVHLTAEIMRITQQIQMKSKWFKEKVVNQEMNKFKTTNSYTATTAINGDDDEIQDEDNDDGGNQALCFMDILWNRLEDRGASREVIKNLREMLEMELFETDSFIRDFEDDIASATSISGKESQSNQSTVRQLVIAELPNELHQHGLRREIFGVISDLIALYRSRREAYCPGYRMFYWPFYKNNEAESNVVYEGVSEQNQGYRLCDWYIESKYKDFKTEMLSNLLSDISMNEWDLTLQKATLKLAAYQSNPNRRRLICGVKHVENGQVVYFSNPNRQLKMFGIKDGDPVTVQHIMALMFHTNFEKASYELAASFRRIFWNETDESLKRRHAAFVHQSRLLRELVEAFGVQMRQCVVPVFYHGISEDIVFEGTKFNKHGPLCTTSAFHKAHGVYAGDSGLVLDIRNDGFGQYLFEALLWSDFTEEREYFFIGGLLTFEFIGIHDVARQRDYGPFIRPMTMLQGMLIGFPYEICPITSEEVDALKLLITNCLSRTDCCSQTGVYINKLFRNLTEHIHRVEINMREMNRFENDKGNRFGYRLLKPLFFTDCDSDTEVINFSLLFRLFSSHLESVIIYDIKSGKYGFRKSLYLNDTFGASLKSGLDIVMGSHLLHQTLKKIVVVYPHGDINRFISGNKDLVEQRGFVMKRGSYVHDERGSECANCLIIAKNE